MDDGRIRRPTYPTLEALRQAGLLQSALAAIVAAPIAVGLSYVMSLPAAIMPAISLLALAAAAVIAMVARWLRLPTGNATWTASGICALIGCVVAMLTQPEHMLEFFDIAATQQ
jgi:lysylphosphatidylglycerol synthetase-like protein (DUF2156 family)